MAQPCDETCCPPFDPDPWEGREITWEDKRFVADHVRCIFHIPLNFGAVMVRSVEAIEAAGVKSDRMLVLAHDRSLWRTDVFLEVTGDVPGAEMATISGKFMTRVFEGPYSQVRNWIKEMKAHVDAAGQEMKKLFTYYTTCPKCAKKHGKNYVVLLAQI